LSIELGIDDKMTALKRRPRQRRQIFCRNFFDLPLAAPCSILFHRWFEISCLRADQLPRTISILASLMAISSLNLASDLSHDPSQGLPRLGMLSDSAAFLACASSKRAGKAIFKKKAKSSRSLPFKHHLLKM
jgi:hypothetical protein